MEKQMAAPQQTLQDQQSNGPETPKAPKQPMSISVILGLQKTIGNRAVQRLLDPSMIQRQTPPSQLSMPQMRYNPRQSQSFFPDLTYAPHLTSSDQGFIDSFLTEHRLAVSPLFQMMLDGQLTTLDTIVDALRPHILSMIPRSEIENYVGTRFVRIAIPFVARIGPPAPQNIPNDLRPAPSARTSVTLGGAYSGHFNLMVGRPDPHDWTVQVQVAREGGIQRLMLFTYNCTNHEIQLQAGAQVTGEVRLWRHLLLGGFLQIIGGIGVTGGQASGSFFMTQLSAGGQANIEFGSFQIGGQCGGGSTANTRWQFTLDAGCTAQGAVRF